MFRHSSSAPAYRDYGSPGQLGSSMTRLCSLMLWRCTGYWTAWTQQHMCAGQDSMTRSTGAAISHHLPHQQSDDAPRKWSWESPVSRVYPLYVSGVSAGHQLLAATCFLLCPSVPSWAPTIRLYSDTGQTTAHRQGLGLLSCIHTHASLTTGV